MTHVFGLPFISRHILVAGILSVLAFQPGVAQAQPTFRQPTVPQTIVGHAKFPIGHWIIKAGTAFPEATQKQLEDCEYWQCSGQYSMDPRRRRCCLGDVINDIGSNSAPICVVVHGALYRFQHVVRDAPDFSGALRGLECDPPCTTIGGLNIVYFSWPSAVACPIPTMTGTQSSHQGRHILASFLESLPQGRKVCLIGHSYGARVVLSALHQVGLDEARKYYFPDLHGAVGHQCRDGTPFECRSRYRVVLLAAAVDHHWLNPDQRYSLALPRSERLLNVYNPQDLPLMLYSIRLPWAHEALGRSHFHGGDVAQLENHATKIVQPVDVSPLLGFGHSADYYRISNANDVIGYRQALRPMVFFADDRIGDTTPHAPSSGKSPPNLSMSPGKPKSPHPKTPQTQVRTHAAF